MARSLSEHFDSITSDSIDPLLSDCCFSIPPSSVPESQSTAPITTEPPPILERVRPKRNYILWTAMNKAIFIQWWLITTYGQKPRAEHPRWDKRGLISEGAEISTSRPCITCKDCGQIYAYSPKNGTNIMTRHRERCLPKGKLNQRNIQAAIRTQALRAPPPDVWDESDWKKQLLVTIISLRLPFQIIENQHFRDLLRLTQQAPSLPIIQTGKTLARQLQSTVQIQQQGILNMLPSDAKLSLALDCWTSPFYQAFMAITENLALALCAVIDRHRIKDQILAITTDNASNNKTMFDKVQRTYPDISIVHIPCMAHVIQLSLNKLLHRIKAKPKNDTVDIVWTDELQKASTQRGQKGDIANTLDRVRRLAIYINGSPQRRAEFLRLQSMEPSQLVPIQDPYFNKYCHIECLDNLKLDSEEWRQVDYLLCLTRPFFLYISTFSKTKDVTIHQVFKLYNELFKHLEASIS
ncbi:hypothetical protein N7476_006767 [Penicillium atrosanguineum]|uniref:BED-type domain-containing protein n=1 Tax=Penicillium atrosanguineum TaxID=1132637 RepID=A0A9W9U6U1_9EURO|nr:hypothetical protein N7476_006767 [Penicillium atrosanguineum]